MIFLPLKPETLKGNGKEYRLVRQFRLSVQDFNFVVLSLILLFSLTILRTAFLLYRMVFRDPETGQDQGGEIGLNAGRSNQAPSGITDPVISKFTNEWPGLVATAVRVVN